MGFAIRIVGPSGAFFWVSRVMREAGKVNVSATSHDDEALLFNTRDRAKGEIAKFTPSFRKKVKPRAVVLTIRPKSVDTVEARFTDPKLGWYPLENIAIVEIEGGHRYGRLVQISETYAIVAFPHRPWEFDGLSMWMEERFDVNRLHRVEDSYNKRLKGIPA